MWELHSGEAGCESEGPTRPGGAGHSLAFLTPLVEV